ncbi:MAG: polyprenyl synthetase family protein [Ruminococcaceae bacterium]|nr:polyprenyl synthetase family protein [Oscillospiraceae bacterium]
MQNDYALRLKENQQRIEAYLNTLYADTGCGYLNEAMRYSLLSGGKRIRAVLTLEFCRLFVGNIEAALQAGAAVEMVHAYSLIHDDLPCMDNDDLRRGKPTSHRVYGEAGAVLAGDALLTEAFSVLSQVGVDAPQALKMVGILSGCAGAYGMVGGQVLDLLAESEPTDETGVLRIQSLKTGALIKAACQLGVCCSEAGEKALHAAAEYAAHLGLAFQICDDLLDAEGSAEKMGKATGMDEKKTTFLSLFGAAWCRQRIEEETKAAQRALAEYEGAGFLCWLAEKLAVRDH